MLKIDLHIHSVASGHAMSSIMDNVRWAKENKMKVIAITDHGYGIKETNTDHAFFEAISRIPKKMSGIRVLTGIEANIMNSKGDLDVPTRILNKLDIVNVGLHLTDSYKKKDIKSHTNAVINALKKNRKSILTHSYFDQHYEIDIEKIAKAAIENNVLLEMNISCFNKSTFFNEKRYMDNLKKILKIIKENKKKVIVNSDAHFHEEIGDDKILKKYQKEIGLTNDMIINNYPKELEKALGVKF